MGPNLEALIAEQTPGRCCVCDKPLPKSKGRRPRSRLCGNRECERAYNTATRPDYRTPKCEGCGEYVTFPCRRGCKRPGSLTGLGTDLKESSP